MRVTLDYGRTGLEAQLPESRVEAVLELPPTPPLPDPDLAIAAALAHPIGCPPLAEIARGKRDVCILVCDITRPVPNQRILPPLLSVLREVGIPKEKVLLLVATGLHRPNEGDELVEMLGPEIAAEYRVANHDGRDVAGHAYLGQTERGVPVHIDRRYVDADLKITTGLIEPHLMAGYSGGRKVICPGIAGLPTVRAWHSPRFIEHPRAAEGQVDGNPVHEENTRIAQMSGCDFVVNVLIDGQRRITQVVAGDMIQAWERGVEHCRRQVRVRVPAPVDIVVTSSAGYPLDTTFYQSVKGMTAALPIVKPNGTIVLVAGMAEGIGSPEFRSLLGETDSLAAFVERIQDPDHFVLDQWQLEELAKVRRHCRVRVVTDGLAPETLSGCFVEPAASVEEAVAAALADHGPDARIAVIPKGPYVLAEVGIG